VSCCALLDNVCLPKKYEYLLTYLKQICDLTSVYGVQVTCTVSGLDWLSVVRVEKRDDEKETTMVIADNGDSKHPFSRLSRYNVRFETIDDIGTVSIYYQGT